MIYYIKIYEMVMYVFITYISALYESAMQLNSRGHMLILSHRILGQTQVLRKFYNLIVVIYDKVVEILQRNKFPLFYSRNLKCIRRIIELNS